jgi:hypothetical protein
MQHKLSPTPYSDESVELLRFAEASTPTQVACGLFFKFGPHAIQGKRPLQSIVHLPHQIGAVRLVGDLIVRDGRSVKLVSRRIGAVKIVVGRHRIRVERGGSMDLVRLELSDSEGSSAVYSEGVVQMTNSTFSRCSVGMNFVSKFGEGLVDKGDGRQAPRQGAYLGAVGGAVFCSTASAKCGASGSTFANNQCNGTNAVVSFGAAVFAFGGTVVLQSTALRHNVVYGGSRAHTSSGGAAMLLYARLDATDVSFQENSASGPARFVLGGALGAAQSVIRAQSTVFEANTAAGGRRSSEGGAIAVHERSVLEAIHSVFRGNEANALGFSHDVYGGKL